MAKGGKSERPAGVAATAVPAEDASPAEQAETLRRFMQYAFRLTGGAPADKTGRQPAGRPAKRP